MRRLLYLIIVLATLFSGYWFVVAAGLDIGLGNWILARQEDGWVAEYSDLSTSGFPTRFETTLKDLELADPRTGVAWSAPEFRIIAPSYRPTHITAIWPHQQTLASPYRDLTITSSTMQGLVGFGADTSLPLTKADITLDKIDIVSDNNWKVHLGQGSFTIDRDDSNPLSYAINLDAMDVSPALTLFNITDPANILPDAFETLSIKTIIGFDAPWDRKAIERRRPQITNLKLTILKAKWGDLDIWAAGKLTVDKEGWPTGKITLKAKNWREMLQIGVASGWVPPDAAPKIEQGLAIVAAFSGNPNTIDAPLGFGDHQVWLGPVPLGPAPQIRLR